MYNKRYYYENLLIKNEEDSFLVLSIEQHASQNGVEVKEEVARNFLKNFKERWLASNRTKERFEEKNESWLDSLLYEKKTTSAVEGGRKRVSFVDLSQSQKRRRTAGWLNSWFYNKIFFLLYYKIKYVQNYNNGTKKVIRNYVSHSIKITFYQAENKNILK